ncbi:MAG: GGDEF domain-containing protein [Lachnospiraceae bacterium]|nr:GGDEF domain-containing protein [Lachnospiraceae bacterium]
MQNEYVVLYLEINLMSVLLIAIIGFKTRGISQMVAQRNFSNAINAEAAFFISDTVAALMAPGFIPFNRGILLLSKFVYFFSTTLMCYFWFIYFEHRQGSSFVKDQRKVNWSASLVWVMTALLIINCFTGVLFYVDDQNVYHRGPLFLSIYVLSYFYVLITAVHALIGVFDKNRHTDRRLLISLALFPIAPALAGVSQFLFPRIPVACMALSLCTLIMYLNWVDEIVSIDPLTRLNNRKQLLFHYEQLLRNIADDGQLYLLMIDANRFKAINDTYGHLQGDAALERIAEALRKACRGMKKRANIARYGGDEFVILAEAEELCEVEELRDRIHANLSELNKAVGSPYELTVSIGIAKAEEGLDLKELIEKADGELYEEKKRLRAGHV